MTDLATRLDRFPRERLAVTPTPLDPLPRLSQMLGPQIMLKRDDLTGLALGGDKPRKLEYELAHAREQGADTVVTCGSMQSNHARLTSAAARKLGMDCAVVLSRDAYDEFQGNLLTVRLLGADIHVVDADDHWALEPHAMDLCDRLRQSGRHPHYIPISGTTPRSCLGYVRAGLELATQIRENGLRPDAVYLPFGTGGIFTAIVRALRDQDITAPVRVVHRPVTHEQGLTTGERLAAGRLVEPARSGVDDGSLSRRRREQPAEPPAHQVGILDDVAVLVEDRAARAPDGLDRVDGQALVVGVELPDPPGDFDNVSSIDKSAAARAHASRHPPKRV